MEFVEGGGDVLGALAQIARGAVHGAERCGCDPEAVRVLADRDDGAVVRHGGIVAKAHAPGTEDGPHAVRLALAGDPALAAILLPPVPGPRTERVAGRPVTVWPYGPPVDPGDPDAAPWEEAARLLALLHRTPPPSGPLPGMRAPAKAALAVGRMLRAAPDHPATATVLAAWRTVTESLGEGGTESLSEGGTGGTRAYLCHGDFHLGQLVRDLGGDWRLIDVDDAGLGDPAWDLARPAAWFAAGLLPAAVWARFLGAYEAAGGPATRPGPDPWARLDLPARALTVQTAALALAKSTAEARGLDEVEGVMIDTCARIALSRTVPGSAASS
ncbi:aminoglycoside phosphotransferase family protein [Streptomyces sp. R302]|uniref:aminoglycoside phosphotransferase family protein n=1 Tax=unclassified Streptomyces TaxID=2593676 RepID=UPI00145C4BAC|nr:MULTISPECIES: aminoglycoside phosphotransferase family protein [unclassified Streptomyces]NML53545.1 aminoglycoside phosphotransferase family protein [Streptomyces sp. R301]NML81906.1 aminoglycoside phosphotransferase family protein [Streptomyces sp. R302]